MTTVRLTEAQNAKLKKAQKILEATFGRKLSRGETIEALARFATRNRGALAPSKHQGKSRKDPFFDLSLIFDLGPTRERSHDPLLYGKR